MTVEPIQPTEDDDAVNEAEVLSRIGALTEAAYTMDPDKFTALKVADRDLVLFLMLREMAATVRRLDMRVDEFEEKAKGMFSPEGIQELTEKFLGGGGMFGGLFK